MTQLEESLKAGKFTVTVEIGPPKGIDVREALEGAEALRGRVAAFNVTDQQSSVMRLGSLAPCHFLKDRGLEPVLQVTCRDRNRIALQSDLLSAYVLGVENVLCLTGDYVTMGDHPQAKPVFDLDSVTLLQVASRLQQGQDMMGNPLKGTPRFFLGAVVTPGADPVELQVIKMEKKVQAGAQFFQTQAVYDAREFEDFMKRVSHLKVPVLLGIVILKSPGMARFMNKNVPGVHVPEAIIEELEKAPNKAEKSLEITARLIQETRHLCQGVHLMPLGWEKRMPALLDKVGL